MADTKRETAAAVFPVDDDCRLMARIRKVKEDTHGTRLFSEQRCGDYYEVRITLVDGHEIKQGGESFRWLLLLTKALDQWDEMTGS